MGSADSFTIEVRFLSELTEKQKAAFRVAEDRWTKVIVGDLPDVKVDGEVVDDLLILVKGEDIDGPGGIIGQSGPIRLRPANAGAAAFLPAKARVTIDEADLAQMERQGTLEDLATHFIGRALGLGTIWTNKGLVQGTDGYNPIFVGKNAQREYAALLGNSNSLPVPIENVGDLETRNSGWRESVFGNEVMTGYKGANHDLISRVTVGALEDMGYKVNYNGADGFRLPHQ